MVPSLKRETLARAGVSEREQQSMVDAFAKRAMPSSLGTGRSVITPSPRTGVGTTYG